MIGLTNYARLYGHYVSSMQGKCPCSEEAGFWSVQLDCNWTDKTADFVCQSQSNCI